jgi:hypothetical protein
MAQKFFCDSCKFHHQRNLSGGWREVLCKKFGGKADGLGGSGISMGKSWEKCQNRGYEYQPRNYRGKPLPDHTPELVAVKLKDIRIKKIKKSLGR